MTVVQINSTYSFGSTGKICMEISKLLNKEGIKSYILHGQGDCKACDSVQFCNRKYIRFESAKAHILGNYGFNSTTATKKLIAGLKKLKPDIVHIHNIHSHDVNVEMLFEYLKKSDTKIVWTFHDCWAFTAYCTHFDYIKCNKWKNGCYSCPQYKGKSLFFDRSRELFEKKKNAFEGLDLTIVTPSKWLSELVGKSFLKDYPRFVINNGIEKNVFFKRNSDFKEKHNIKGKMVLGVAYKWNNKKGLDVFIEMSKRLGREYTVVLVGADKAVEKSLPDEIIAVPKTHSKEELAEIYSAADVFFNPTREDTYPTVNMEAVSCGTPVVAFKTGGSPEIIGDDCGISVEKDNIKEAEEAIRKVCETHLFNRENLEKKSLDFDSEICFSKYTHLYKSLLEGRMPEKILKQ